MAAFGGLALGDGVEVAVDGAGIPPAAIPECTGGTHPSSQPVIPVPVAQIVLAAIRWGSGPVAHFVMVPV